MHRRIALVLTVMLMLSACGDSRLERTGSGAAIGAGVGYAGGALCCGDPGGSGQSGLFIGMVVGALVGYLVDEPLFFNYHKD